MLIAMGNSILNIKTVFSAIISPEFKDKKVREGSGFLGLFPKYKTEKVFDTFKLLLDYEDIAGKRYTFHASNPNREPLEKMVKDLIAQVKRFDNDLVTAALENAIFGDGNGSNSN